MWQIKSFYTNRSLLGYVFCYGIPKLSRYTGKVRIENSPCLKSRGNRQLLAIDIQPTQTGGGPSHFET